MTDDTWEIGFGPEITQDYARATRREWLETNGIGGWASSTVCGAHTRRYHGLLVAALQPPVGRVVLLSRLDETLHVGYERHELSCSRFPGVVHPRGYEYLERFQRDLFPVFSYAAGEVRLRKTVAAIHGQNTVVIVYEALVADTTFLLELRPFVAGRDYHQLTQANDEIRRDVVFAAGQLRLPSYDELPEVRLQVTPESQFSPATEWYYDYEYDREQYRGLDFREDLFTHGTLQLRLAQGERAIIVASAEPGSEALDGAALLAAETARREALLADRATTPLARHLHLAADQFLVRRGADQRTIIAGYPWFTDWGRDTMIALPGIALVTGRHDEARKILEVFAGAVSKGMLPNRFPDAGETPDYNTVDATLWFFVAIHHYLAATGDEDFVRETLLPVLGDIIQWHERGTRYGIRVDEDGLLSAGADGQQLTWMDAKVGNWVVTPRRGKPVEIQALWYNALRIYGALCAWFNAPASQAEAEAKARRVRASFAERFWNGERGCLYDVIDGDELRADASVRPNQIFALSLPFPLVDGNEAAQVLAVVEAELLTPRGLRSLSPQDPAYQGHYGGSPLARDSAYHQGTVWAWLIGPYLTALRRFGGDDAEKRGRAVLAGFRMHLGEACVGSVSEIFDGDAPHEPRGAMAQAWSVAELLRALEDMGEPARTPEPSA